MMHSETCDTVGVGVCKICIMQNIVLGATHNKSMERRYYNNFVDKSILVEMSINDFI